VATAETRERGGASSVGRKGAASRMRILACAVDLSRRAGLEALSFGSVAEAAGLSKSAVVNHFGARPRLQAATVDALACEFRREVLAPADGLTGLHRLRRLYAGFLAWMERGCPLAAATLADGGLSEPLRSRAADGLASWRRILRDAIADAARCGEVADAVDADQVSFELTGAALVYRLAIGAVGDETAQRRAWLAFERSLPALSN